MMLRWLDAITIIDAVEDMEYEYNDWETKFINGIKDNKKDLSDKQSACLTKLYGKATGGGDYVNKQYFR